MIDTLPQESHERIFKFLKSVLGDSYQPTLPTIKNKSNKEQVIPEIHNMLQEQLDALSGYMRKELSAKFRQTEALMSLHAVLQIKHPLPSMTGMAITPDFARILTDKILELKPNIIVETGSGVSTLITAYACKKNGKGKIYSLENHQYFAAESAKNIQLHGLEEFAEIIYAPLRPATIDKEKWLWYDTNEMKFKKKSIDLLIVDGPPANVQEEARYPALPLLENYLSDTAIIISDDTLRTSEQEVIKRWLQEFNYLKEEKIFCEKGASILSRNFKKRINN